jgi:hypothetical protein
MDASQAEDEAIVDAYARGRAGASSASAYYSRQHVRIRQGGDGSFNWAALLFGPFWCVWRKMYGLGLLVLLVTWAIGEAADLYTARYHSGDFNFLASFVLVRVWLAFRVNRWYLGRAARVARRLKAAGYHGDQLLCELRRRGGIDPVIAGGAFLTWYTGPYLAPRVLGMLRYLVRGVGIL